MSSPTDPAAGGTGWPEAADSEEVSALQVAARLGGDRTGVRLLDCREDDEFAFNRIAGATHVPLSRWAERAPALLEAGADGDHGGTLPLVVYCHHGMRSLQAVRWLRAHGMDACFSLAGGIEAWSNEIDPAVPRY